MDPKSLRQILRETLTIYRERFLPFITIAAMAQIPVLLLDSLLRSPENEISQFDILAAITIIQYLVIAALTLLSIVMMYAASVHAVSGYLAGSPINVIRSYEIAWQRNKQLASAGGIITLAILAMAITVIGLPVAIYYGIRWAFALPAAMIEGASPRDALHRSSYLVRGRWWSVFFIVGAIALLWGFTGSLTSGVVGLLTGMLLGTFLDSQEIISQVVGIAGGLVWVLFTPFMLIGLSLIYWDLRVRKEGISKESISEQLDFPTGELESALSEKDDSLDDREGYGERSTRLSRRRRRQLVEINLRQSLSSRRSWIVIAIVLAVLIAGYYTVLAMRYWQATEETEVLNANINRVSRNLRQDFEKPEALEARLEPKLQNLEELREKFTYPNSDTLVAILSQTAQEIPVGLTSISVGNPDKKIESITEYDAQPMTISLKGGTPEIYRFIDSLHDKVIVTSVTNIRMASVSGEAPSAQVGLLFFLSPEQAADKEGAKR